MVIPAKLPLVAAFLLAVGNGWSATLFVDGNSPTPTPPYSSWATAAATIQEAIDAATDGDLVLVTNGVYATGGKVMFGDLTNRVALDKAITVQSVNGPYVTTIRGNGATNGLNAVRCAWITNGATLQGFTLTGGATRTSGDQTNLLSGGGALCLSTNAVLQNCLVISNVAQTLGGGVFQGVIANTAIIGNRSGGTGSGAMYATLLNSTVVSNWQVTATFQCRVTNSIVYHNAGGNYSGGSVAYTCTTPLPAGSGNISAEPQLFPDAIHLKSTSPCRAAGINLTMGMDIDGQAWGNPPSMGCDEWGDDPIIITQPQVYHDVDPVGFRISVVVAGAEPITCYWTRNGVPIVDDGHFIQSSTPDLIGLGISELDAGNYQVVVSNAFGVVTSAPVEFGIRFVNATNPAPVPPYTSWNTAATNIQDAIDAAAVGDLVLVTNGVYAHGGKVMAGDLTNRVAIDKAIAVRSVNGPWVTTILGVGATNWFTAVRCAWLTNGAILQGFTLTAGAARASGDALTLRRGGGAWCVSSNAIISNCIIKSNAAANYGSALYQGTLRNSLVIENQNTSPGDGAVANAVVINCTIVSNLSVGVISHIPGALRVTNSIVYYNAMSVAGNLGNHGVGGLFTSSCTTPLPQGGGNFTNAPLLQLNGIQLSSASPCRGAGTNVASGADLYGRPWAHPPSIGCAEWVGTPSFEIQPRIDLTTFPGGLAISFKPEGETPMNFYWYRDDTLLSDDGHFNGTGTTNLFVRKIRETDAGNYSVVVSNSFGMATSQVVQVVFHFVDAAGINPVPPYTSWATAANSIQEAIDVAEARHFVLVTNGIYAAGGKVMAADLLNRVAIDKPLTVISVNGYRNTVIEGAWDPVSTNGPAAVRGVWMTNQASLVGFTVRNGATRSGAGSDILYSGGGVWAGAVNQGAIVMSCFLNNNAASYRGGGAYGGNLRGCVLTGNIVGVGGGNGPVGGGGAAYSELRNCTVYNNTGSSFPSGGGTYECVVLNSIVLANFRSIPGFTDNYYPQFPSQSSYYAFSSSEPRPSGASNTNLWAVFVDSDYHLVASSPLRGAGSAIYASSIDIDGEPWANPPSMGADEVIEENLAGPIAISIIAWPTNVLVSTSFVLPPFTHRVSLGAVVAGRISHFDWDYGDGSAKTNTGYGVTHAWTNTGSYTVTATAFNTDNLGGVSASMEIQVLPLIQPTLQSVSLDSSGFKFGFEAQETAHYSVVYATNLTPPIAWSPFQTILSSPGGWIQFIDTAPTNAARFYRVRAL